MDKGCFETMIDKIRFRMEQRWNKKQREKRHELFQEYFNTTQIYDI